MISRIIFGLFLALALAVVFYTGLWHIATLFVWQHPMLTWIPLLPLVIAIALRRGGQVIGFAFLASLAIFLFGLGMTLFAPARVAYGDIDFRIVKALPEQSQPRLLPRTGVRDDPSFADSKEIHLTRDPVTGDLLWTGEWQGSWLAKASQGVAVKALDDIVSKSEIRFAGFDKSASASVYGSFKWNARRRHPFSRIQYPVLIPTGANEAIAIAPYIGYRGFPFRTPYLKGVLVYHQDGRTEDLTPEEAAARPELASSGRIVPEAVARRQAEALADLDAVKGKIVDGEGNKQPFLTAINRNRTVWMSIINSKRRRDAVEAVVLADSTTGKTDVWRAPEGSTLVSTEQVLRLARSMPLTWKERRCCNSDGHSYTVTLREVVEPRLAFKRGRPYYMVTIVPTRELILTREVEYTLLIDALTGKEIDRFDHDAGGTTADARLNAFFSD